MIIGAGEREDGGSENQKSDDIDPFRVKEIVRLCFTTWDWST